MINESDSPGPGTQIKCGQADRPHIVPKINLSLFLCDGEVLCCTFAQRKMVFSVKWTVDFE